MLIEVLLSISQVSADVFACYFSWCSARASNNKFHKRFFLLNSITFFLMIFGDIYYNYSFRISNQPISQSGGLLISGEMLVFQLSQIYNWYSCVQKKTLFTRNNIPYFLFVILAIGVLLYFLWLEHGLSNTYFFYQGLNILLDMAVWLLATVCLARAKQLSDTYLCLGCLLIISSDLAIRCLFMSEMNEIVSMSWVHAVWTLGVISMALGFWYSVKRNSLVFCEASSLQASCSAWVSITAFLAFAVVFAFFALFLGFSALILWNLPIAIMFTIIASVLLANRFSNLMLWPINQFLRRIDSFNSGAQIVGHGNNETTSNIYEFKLLGDFIDSSFNKLSSQLDREIKIAAQVAHDIRSPLSALEMVIRNISELEEPKRVLLRDAINHIRDITNNLEKDLPSEKQFAKREVTQISILLGYVISERRAVLSNQNIQINPKWSVDTYSVFVDVVPSVMKRVLSNIISNACEAVPANGGKVDIEITYNSSNMLLKISDNGPGIPDAQLNQVFDRGFSTKPEGSGLGLYHARENILKWGGDISIVSGSGGAEVTIKLPLKVPPEWFVAELKVPQESLVVCIDDSISVWNGWQERFFSMGNKKLGLKYCSTRELLLEHLRQANAHCVYLVDYEFSGEGYTGIDLIEDIYASGKIDCEIYMVTSRSGEESIQEYCVKHNIKIIPKIFTPKIPIHIQ